VVIEPGDRGGSVREKPQTRWWSCGFGAWERARNSPLIPEQGGLKQDKNENEIRQSNKRSSRKVVIESKNSGGDRVNVLETRQKKEGVFFFLSKLFWGEKGGRGRRLVGGGRREGRKRVRGGKLSESGRKNRLQQRLGEEERLANGYEGGGGGGGAWVKNLGEKRKLKNREDQLSYHL